MKKSEAVVEIVKSFIDRGCPGYALVALGMILCALIVLTVLGSHEALNALRGLSTYLLGALA